MQRLRPLLCALLVSGFWSSELLGADADAKAQDLATVKAEHSDIGVNEDHSGAYPHTSAPGAQWYGDASFGLFIHWGIASVKGINISWPMIPGRALAAKRIDDPAERARIIRESDYNLTGTPNSITPNEYFAQAKDFNPQKYDPDLWMKAAKAAGFTYVVLTTRHHEGFALWPSAYGDFDTKNYMGGRDLLKPYVDACRKYGLKVGFYYSPPDWYFDRDYMNFMYGRGAQRNPEFPPLGPDLKPRTNHHTPEEIAAHQAAFAALVKGQVEELLTRYGKIDLLWFDGKPNIPHGEKAISIERIRELQPDIVINPRLHGHGDFVTYERRLPNSRPHVDWAEFCNTWTNSWPYVKGAKFRATGYVLGQLAQSRAWGINYLLGVGPMSTGEMEPGVYEAMADVAGWMKTNGKSVHGTHPLPADESASVPATAAGDVRYLFAIPDFADGGSYPNQQLPAKDETLTLSGVAKPTSVLLLGSGKPLEFTHSGNTLTVHLPATIRSKLVDVVAVTLPRS